MKVVLLESVEGLGIVGQEVKVKDGYARNYLIPTGKALAADDKTLHSFKDKIQAGIRAEAKNKEQAQRLSAELAGITLRFAMKAGEDGKLFGSVTTTQIHDALKDQGFEIDKKKIVLSEPIRHLGTHEIVARLYPEITATFKAEVVPEEA
ncbi:MAG TPA: 50S ribosomal protein L9 [Deltaproteobacteria bacterium]|nr:50S ribosomal protein L9 [Deltaproteobacteria bacterium]